MARKTFGRDGQPIIVGEVGHSEPLSIVESKPDEFRYSVSGSGNVENLAPFGDERDTDDAPTADLDFEPVGDSVRVAESYTDNRVGYVDPATAAARRPRKPRGPNKPKPEASKASVNTAYVTETLEKVLVMLHSTAAAMVQMPELKIDADEAKALAESVAKVAEAYNLGAVFSPKTQALIDLALVCGVVYGPRIVTLAKRPKHPIRNVTNIAQATH